MGDASSDLEDTAKAAAIIILMAANFEHMWFISFTGGFPCLGMPLTLALISGLASRCDFRHIQASRPGFGGPN